MSNHWRLGWLGVPRLDRGGLRPLALARKDAGWLAYVALNPGVASLRVATLVWPAATERGALNNLRQRVHRLRKLSGARLVEMAETIVLAPDLQADDLDVTDGSVLDDAEFLVGIDFDPEPELAAWLQATRARLATQRREALARLASEAERAGELARALHLAQRLVAVDAVSEHAHRRLMRLHYLRGDRAAALAAFDACERVLKDELGVRPGTETLALLKTVDEARVLPAAVLAPVPVGLLRPPRTVGREEPVRRLAEAHAAGETPVLVGEAGLGKTRLLQDFVATLPQAVYVQARPSDAGVPYGALARLLRAVLALAPSALVDDDRLRLACIVPELRTDASVPATQPPAQVRAAIVTLLAGAAALGPDTLVLDDLHFADRASIELLCTLLDEPGVAMLRWVFAHRPADAADEDSALLRSLDDAPQVQWIRLQPLGPAGVADLLDSLGMADADAAAGLVPALVRHTGGNPLYVIETLRAMAVARVGGGGGRGGADDGLPRPASIEHLLDRRLERLSKPALALARVAAIAVPDFSIELAEQALAAPALTLADAWHELERADLLRGEAFAHDLVRDAVLRTTPSTIAQHAHRQVAGFLAQRGVEPARVAAHWVAGGVEREAAAAFRVAAARALASGRTREQHELLEAAAQAHERAGDVDAALQLRNEAIGARLRSDGPAAALAQADQALAGAWTAAQRAPLLCSRAVALLWVGRAAEAEADAQQALATAADDAVTLAAARYLAHARAFQGDAPGAATALQAWSARADAVADARMQAEFYGDLGTLLMRAERPAAALQAVERHLALAQQVDDGGEQVNALLNLFALRLRAGDVRAALAAAQRADPLLADPAQARTLWAWNRTHIGIALCRLARFAEGLTVLDEARQVLADIHENRIVVLNEDRTAETLLLLGQTARAQTLVSGSSLPPGAHLTARLALRAQVAQAMGQDDEPLWREVEAAVGGSDRHDQVRTGIELLRFEPDLAVAVAKAQGLEQAAADLGYAPLALQAAARRLSLHLQQRDLPALGALVGRVETMALALDGNALQLPQQLLDCTLAYRQLGREADARRCLAHAGRWLHEVVLDRKSVV